MKSGLRRQTMLMSCANGVTRGLGFLMKLLLARLMSAEALGLMEMAGAAGMLALTPVAAGIPSAMSRLTAQRAGKDRPAVLAAGLSLVGRLCMLLVPAWLVLTPAVAWLLGDLRALPALAVYAPAMLLIGMCGVYCGYCFGCERPRLPALFECAEEVLKLLFCAGFLLCWPGAGPALAAALPGIARIGAGVCAVLLFRHALPLPRTRSRPSPVIRSEVLRLASPMMFAQLCGSGMRALNAVLLPVCLRRSGLSQAAATAQFGLLNGMAMPLIMAPCMITGALCTVSTPVVARLEQQPMALHRLKRRLSLSAWGIGSVSAAALYLGADVLGSMLFGQPALPPLVRLMAPLALLMSIRQVQMGMITGLGLQRQSVGGTLMSSLLVLLVTAWLCPLPQVRLFGAAIAMLTGQLAGLVWNAVLLHRTMQRNTAISL